MGIDFAPPSLRLARFSYGDVGGGQKSSVWTEGNGLSVGKGRAGARRRDSALWSR